MAVAARAGQGLLNEDPKIAKLLSNNRRGGLRTRAAGEGRGPDLNTTIAAQF